MGLMPFQLILGFWFRSLLVTAMIGGGIYLVTRWYDESRVTEPVPEASTSSELSRRGQAEARQRAFRPRLGGCFGSTPG